MENIEVALRVRPMNPSETESKDIDVWTVMSDDDIITITPDKLNDLIKYRKIAPGQKTQYLFNKCFDKNATNRDLYDSLVKRIALSSLQGINGTVFMYGQTGSGKTFSMMGSNHGNSSGNSNSTPEHGSMYSATPQNVVKLSQNPIFQRLSRQNSQNFYGENLSSSNSNQMNSGTIVPSKFNVNTLGCRLNALSQSPPKIREITPSRMDGFNMSNGHNTPDQQQGFKSASHLNNNTNSFKQIGLNCMSQAACNPLRDFIEGTNVLFDSDFDTANNDGILVHGLQDIFLEIDRAKDKQFLVRASYVEIYNDNVYDLLKPQENLHETCTINEDYNKEFIIQGATEQIIQSIDEVLQLIKRGQYNRHYASTSMNHVSSRSHAIFRLYVRSMAQDYVNTHQVITDAILNFVDLAGSQKIDIHNSLRKRCNSGGGNLGIGSSNLNKLISDRQTQSQTINKSLFFLTQVISLKSEGKHDSHIPYRNSPLTKILRSSLGGNSRTAIILCVNPCVSQIEQTVSTMRFGMHAKKIENNVQKNVIMDTNNTALQNVIQQYEQRIHQLENERNSNKELKEQLLHHIMTLNEQKKGLEQCVNIKKKMMLIPENSNIQEIIDSQKKDGIFWKDSKNYYAGIIYEIDRDPESQQETEHGNSIKEDIERRLVNSLHNIKQQRLIIEKKSDVLKKKLEESQKLRIEDSEKLRNLIYQKNGDLENHKNKQIAEMLTSNNNSMIPQLDGSTLLLLEKNLNTLLNQVKNQRALSMFTEIFNETIQSGSSYSPSQIQREKQLLATMTEKVNQASFAESAPLLVFPESIFDSFSVNIEENPYLKNILPIQSDLSLLTRSSAPGSQQPSLIHSPLKHLPINASMSSLSASNTNPLTLYSQTIPNQFSSNILFGTNNESNPPSGHSSSSNASSGLGITPMSPHTLNLNFHPTNIPSLNNNNNNSTTTGNFGINNSSIQSTINANSVGPLTNVYPTTLSTNCNTINPSSTCATEQNFSSFQNYFNAVQQVNPSDNDEIEALDIKLNSLDGQFNYYIQNMQETQSQYRELLMTENSACTHNFQQPIRYTDGVDRANLQQSANTSTMASMEYQEGFFYNALNSGCKDGTTNQRTLYLEGMNILKPNNNTNVRESISQQNTFQLLNSNNTNVNYLAGKPAIGGNEFLKINNITQTNNFINQPPNSGNNIYNQENENNFPVYLNSHHHSQNSSISSNSNPIGVYKLNTTVPANYQPHNIQLNSNQQINYN